MKILILGAGAIGGYLGSRLVEAGADVNFLVREARRAQLDREGLRLRSVFGDVDCKVVTVSAGELKPDNDLAIVTCKAYDLDSAIEAIGPGLSQNGLVLPILNGLGHIATLNAAFGQDRVLGGTIKLSASRLADGTIKHMNDWHWLRFGEQAGGLSDRVLAVQAAFDGCVGLEAVPQENIMQEMWEKFVHLTTAAAMTCLMRANSGQILATDEGASLFQQMLETSANIARASGYPPSDEFMETYRTLFADRDGTYATSMLRDIEAGNRTEGEQIVGLMLQRAREFDIDSPLLTAAYAHLKAYEVRQANGGKI
ncbi:MAG: ketopantoate reductase family protein [Alphaproteobacteria bacterium]|nr:ketopantoate reductase family protein [Alphaproteobacteria bacterium]